MEQFVKDAVQALVTMTVVTLIVQLVRPLVATLVSKIDFEYRARVDDETRTQIKEVIESAVATARANGLIGKVEATGDKLLQHAVGLAQNKFIELAIPLDLQDIIDRVRVEAFGYFHARWGSRDIAPPDVAGWGLTADQQ